MLRSALLELYRNIAGRRWSALHKQQHIGPSGRLGGSCSCGNIGGRIGWLVIDRNDHITTLIIAPEELAQAITTFSDYIKRETLSDELIQKGNLEYDLEKELEIENFKLKIAIKR